MRSKISVIVKSGTFKTAKACNLDTFQNSNEPCISGAELKVDAGRKMNTKAEIEEAKSRLRMQEITGMSNKGREGLGLRKRNTLVPAQGRGKER